ncbi:histone-lysine N-methyltransferase SETD7 isoform X2 [Eurytemora carolleeae]|uniref:histone-lysine N-methyltransferase SETD7 isoform X2 n=1 Tax=Eurytemora carolleeae TaxID=1294199 RepID=UPI000C78B55B|nr:histone-lysine N-methyltransferase SETD7 isoform X2 [Eurytemora carolleeae]|eukprot:XP_023325406.1 histone-lysine N-methyltransferase SETD7-like isoform X2 [Eurytemora affinis]
MKVLVFVSVCLFVGFARSSLNMTIRSTCSNLENQKWNNRKIGDNIRVWWNSLTTVFGSKGPNLYLFYSGGTSSTPAGVTWQMAGRERRDGFIYGKPDTQGFLTGDDLVFIYPDFRTGLLGRFTEGILEYGREIKITWERCNMGVKEIQYQVVGDHVWRRDIPNATHIGLFPNIVDPYERKAVHVRSSNILGSNEGLYSRRNFLPGDLVSYFNGVKTFEENFLFPNLTSEEHWIAQAYYLDLYDMSPTAWNLPKDIVIDIPVQYRSLSQYRTTYTHKTNHKFEDTNVEFDAVLHPMFGPIGCIVATQLIPRDTEIFVNYGYGMEYAPDWYRDLWKKHKKMKRLQSGKNITSI